MKPHFFLNEKHHLNVLAEIYYTALIDSAARASWRMQPGELSQPAVIIADNHLAPRQSVCPVTAAYAILPYSKRSKHQVRTGSVS